MSDRVRPSRRRRRVRRALLVLAVLLLGGLGTLAWQTYLITQQLDDRVRVTQDLADGNVRTLSQVQRELLQLETLLVVRRPDPAEVRLQQELAAQRVQEGALSYQEKSLGSQSLLTTARDLQQQWDEDVAPTVRAAARAPVDSVERETAVSAVADLELQYNQLVSAAENTRKTRAAESNATVRELLVSARYLLLALALTTILVLAYAVFSIWGLRRLDRQRTRAAEALVASNRDLQRHAFVARSTDNSVLLTDELGRVEWVNDSFTAATGWTLEEIAGRSPGEVLQGPDTDPETVQLMRERLDAGEAFRVEILNYTRSRQEMWVTLEVNPVRDEHGRLTGFVALQTDVTERRLAEQHLRAAKDAAEASAREKAGFLASMSHEIRTPLNAVLGFTDLLLLTDLDDEQRGYLETSQNSGQMLLALVNDILDFSALEAGRVETEARAFAPDRAVRDVVAMFERQALDRGLELRAELDDAAPEAVVGDETRLRQVLVNLVGNALKFTQHGGVTVALLLDEQRGAPADEVPLVVRVSDTGIGIPGSRMERLFHPFTQVDSSTTRKYGGTGLGLAICHALLEQMGGTIEVTSLEGQGSTFTVRLSLPRADAADLGRSQLAASGELPAVSVLLAEDDRVNQTVITHMLRRLGIEPVVVADGAAAVVAAIEHRPDVVLMDVHMPVVDGVEACQQVTAALGAARPRIIAVTANALPGDRDRFLGAGFDDYVSKPLRLDALTAALLRAAGAGAEDDESWPGSDLPPVVDRAEFALRIGSDDPALLEQMVRLVVDQADQRRSEIVDHVTRGDLVALGLCAHRLRGAALAAGASRMATVAGAVEELADQGVVPALALVLDDLDTERDALHDWLDRHAAADGYHPVV